MPSIRTATRSPTPLGTTVSTMWRAISAFCAARCGCAAWSARTRFWPIWAFRRTPSTRRTAADVVNRYDADSLARVLRDYGELETTWKIAACIVRSRERSPLLTTSQLVAAVAPCTPKRDESKFLTKLFQALRIEVNGEMEALKMALEQSLKVLRPGGRLAVISYHSLEDRLVKNFMRSGNFEGRVEWDFYGRASSPFEVVTRKAVVPSAEEVARNPRSRSAKLRAAVKL